ncbi:acyl carrier protein [Nocardia sp. NBC_01327]|uniref:acyl carrier protein n=1 Tax=Nocardia sp. NBC_01327 TaxID=2903593 RepID=UPI002E14190A|nr:acyl carrier protein [Nocardia sp. NBC_01327]
MNESTVCEAIAGELSTRGYQLDPEEYRTDLISAGVNSVNLVRVLTALEELFDIEFEAAGFFAEPVTVERLAAEIIEHAARNVTR